MSQRMIIRLVAGKGGKDRDLPLSPALLEILREYWRWRKPKLYLFPTRTCSRSLDQPISDKTVWIACSEAARQAGISKRVTHTRLVIVLVKLVWRKVPSTIVFTIGGDLRGHFALSSEEMQAACFGSRMRFCNVGTAFATTHRRDN
jgi:Phage integrase family